MNSILKVRQLSGQFMFTADCMVGGLYIRHRESIIGKMCAHSTISVWEHILLTDGISFTAETETSIEIVGLSYGFQNNLLFVGELSRTTCISHDMIYSKLGYIHDMNAIRYYMTDFYKYVYTCITFKTIPIDDKMAKSKINLPL